MLQQFHGSAAGAVDQPGLGVGAQRGPELGAGADPAAQRHDADIQGLRSDAELGLADAVRNANEAMQRIAQINQQLGASNDADATAATCSTSATATSTSSRS